MAPSRDLAARFEAYSDWRRRLSGRISGLHDWLQQHDLADAQVDLRVQQLLERLHQDKLIVAFVAEFSRGKSELINAIFFADFGQRLLPSSAGRTTMCPTELLYDAARPPSIRLLPIETRLKDATVSEFKNYADEWVTLPARPGQRREDGRSAGPRVAGEARAGGPRPQVRTVRRRRGGHARRARGRRRAHDRHSVLAPCRHQFPAPAAAAGAGDPRHAGIERDRHGTGTHAQPAAQCARGAVHPGRRRRRDQDRPRGVEPAPGRRRPGNQGRPLGHPEQDRRPVGRLEVRGRDQRGNQSPDAEHGADAGRSRLAGVRGIGAEGAARQGQRRRCVACAQPAPRARALAVAETHSRQARHRGRGVAGGTARARRGRALDSRLRASRASTSSSRN